MEETNLSLQAADVKKPAPKPPVIKKPVIRADEYEAKDIQVAPESKYDLKFKKDHVQVKGIFRNLETPGGILKFPFRKYREDKITNYTLVDGQTYELPIMVAEHLNENCTVPKYAHMAGSDTIQAMGGNIVGMSGITPAGIPGFQQVGKTQRFSFQPIAFQQSPVWNEAQALASAR